MDSPAFAPFFHGHLAGFEHALAARLPVGRRVLDGTDLLDDAILDALLDRFAADCGATDRRATASQWSKYFFSRLIIPVTVVQLGHDRALDLTLAGLQIAFNDDATPIAFAFDPGPAWTPDGADFSSLVDAALAPVIAALCTRCRLSSRVFWSNAAVYYDWALGELARQTRLPAARIAAARMWLQQPRRHNGERNPLYAPYRCCADNVIDGNGDPALRCRRLCCMRDLDDLWDLCSNCPRAMTRVGAAAGQSPVSTDTE